MKLGLNLTRKPPKNLEGEALTRCFSCSCFVTSALTISHGLHFNCFLKSHYQFYLKSGMSILELGAAEESYLPEGIRPSRHVGVGANAKLMNENPSLTERMAIASER